MIGIMRRNQGFANEGSNQDFLLSSGPLIHVRISGSISIPQFLSYWIIRWRLSGKPGFPKACFFIIVVLFPDFKGIDLFTQDGFSIVSIGQSKGKPV